MGRGINAYVFVAVEITITELRKWLMVNKKGYKNGDYGSSKQDEFDIANDWAAHFDAGKGRMTAFSSVNYEDETINGLYYGVLLHKSYLNAYADGWTEAEATTFATAAKYELALKSVYPKKKAKIVTIIDIG